MNVRADLLNRVEHITQGYSFLRSSFYIRLHFKKLWGVFPRRKTLFYGEIHRENEPWVAITPQNYLKDLLEIRAYLSTRKNN